MPKNTRARTFWTPRSVLAIPVSSPPSLGPSNLLQYVKGRSSRKLLASIIASAVGGILVLCSISGVAAQSGAGEPPRSGWYVGGGIGSNWASDLDQEGWNRDPLCYPTDLCFDADPVPEISGYRWHYDIDAGAVFEISAGLIFDRARMELIDRAAEERPRPDVPQHHLLRWGTHGAGTAWRFGRIQCPGLDRPSHRAHPFAQCVLRFSGCVPRDFSIPG